jgi:hypothetical protein
MEDKTLFLKKLMDVYYQEKNNFIRIKISKVLSELRRIPKVDVQVSQIRVFQTHAFINTQQNFSIF